MRQPDAENLPPVGPEIVGLSRASRSGVWLCGCRGREQYVSQHEREHLLWTIWRHQRVTELSHPLGWTSLIAQHWLHEGDADRALPDLPGTWSVTDGQVMHHPPATSDPNTVVTLDGVTPSGPFTLPQVRSLSAHPRDTLIVLSGSREVETLMRRTTAGDVAIALRIRDPQAAISPRMLSVPAFAYDPSFRVSSRFAPHDPMSVIRETIAPGITDVVQSIGTLHFTLHDREYSVVVFGRPGSHGIEPFTHVRDATSGSLTHEIGRSIDVRFTDPGGTAIDIIDFNYLHSMPCAFTPHVSCPLPIPENTIATALLSGEQTPALIRDEGDQGRAGRPAHT